MEALAALGVAASAVQFVTFASSLISNAVEINSSSPGTTEDVLSMEAIYKRLAELSHALAMDPHPYHLCALPGAALNPLEEGHVLATSTKAIHELSHRCKGDCEKLLGVTRKLKARHGGGPGRQCEGFRVALKTLWKKKDIQDLENRLARTQTTLILHICKVTGDWQVSHQKQLERLRAENLRLQSTHHMRLEDIAKELALIVRDVSRLRTGIEERLRDDHLDTLLKQMAAVTSSNDEIARQQAILQSLSFPARLARRASVSEAHSKTYGWVFGGTTPTSACPDASLRLQRWLEEGSGIFWISGKAGSGKSTFVKFVANDPRTRTALRHWAGSTNVVIASHYFWAAGSAIQRSQQGLLQSLLFDIFRQFPTLAASACSHRWSSALTSCQPPWEVAELHAALRQVANVPPVDADGLDSNGNPPSANFCVFIDGVDEYDGDHLEFCDAVKQLSRSTHFKLCVSSRPWNVFEDAFGHDAARKIYIHELTSRDIRRYAESRLQEHPRWNQIMSPQVAADGQHLLDQITERSSGVFLWVVLVTKLLREGLANDDSVSDLQRRLEGFPVELEQFFKSILDSVEPFYHAKMATTFRIAVHATAPLPNIMYSFHDMEYEDEDYALNLRQGPMSIDAIKELEAQTVRRLNGRSRGLLEVDATGCVNFLHRTVMDFLKTKDIADFLAKQSPRCFNEELSILKAYTAVLKARRWPHQAIIKSSPTEYLQANILSGPQDSTLENNLLIFAGDILLSAAPLDNHPDFGSSTFPTMMDKLLDEVEISLDRMSQRHLVAFEKATSQTFFREMVVDAEIVNYVGRKLAADRRYLDCLDKPVIWPLLMKRVGKSLPFYRPREKMFHLARVGLESGICRDEIEKNYGGEEDAQSPWVLLMDHVLSPKSGPQMSFILESGVILLLLRYGASPTARWGASQIWEKFIHLALTESIGPDRQPSYLRVLDDFIATGRLPGPEESRLRVEGLFQSLAAGCPWSHDKVPLLEGVLDRLLPLLQPISPDEKVIWDSIRKGLPPDVAEGLMSRHKASHHRKQKGREGDNGDESDWEHVSSDPEEFNGGVTQRVDPAGGSVWPLWNRLSSQASSVVKLVKR